MAFVRGLQGNHSRYKRVVATPKHYTGYSVEEVGGVSRTYFDSEIPMEDLSDTYLPAWEAIVTKGDVGSIMCSYNAINGRLTPVGWVQPTQRSQSLVAPNSGRARARPRSFWPIAPSKMFSRVAGTPSCGSKEFQTNVLRKKYGFSGFVVPSPSNIKPNSFKSSIKSEVSTIMLCGAGK